VQAVKGALFRLHRKLVAPELVNVNVSVPEFVGDTLGDADSDGVGGALAANTAYAPHTPTARTPSSATSVNRLALRTVLFVLPLPIRLFRLLFALLSVSFCVCWSWWGGRRRDRPTIRRALD
jgi:hypothetical protein